MGTREKLFRQKLADQIEGLLTKSEKVFTSEKLSNKWLESMLEETRELTSILTIYQFLHDIPEDENLQIEFLELADKEKESEKETEIPSYGDEIMKEIDEFDSEVAVDVKEVKDKPEIIIDEKIEVVEDLEVNISEEEEITVKEEVFVKETLESEVEEVPTQDNPVQEEKGAEINDLIANKEASLADKLRKKSIVKLADSIALNERFLYSNELFNGNMEAFKRALNELDHIASLEDAKRFIEVQLTQENNWNMDSEIVQGFIGLVERRFN